jgi:transglutaminase-like putative cysteine protease
MLRRRGNPAEVVIGVPEDGVGTDPWFAHAWVEVRDGSGSPGYSELVRLVP